MNLVTTETSSTMTSLQLRDIINSAREDHGESKVENSHFLKRIEDELEGELGGTKTFRPAQGGTPMKYYDLTREKIGLSAVMLNRHLDNLGVYNKSIKRGRAFRQSFVDAGHGIMRQTETGHAQPMITLTGEAWIIEKLTSEGII